MNAGREQFARDLSMQFSGNREAHRLDVPWQTAPVARRRHLILSRHFIGARIVDITDAGELRMTFAGERGVNARMLLAQMSNTDDCSPKCHDCIVSLFDLGYQ